MALEKACFERINNYDDEVSVQPSGSGTLWSLTEADEENLC